MTLIINFDSAKIAEQDDGQAVYSKAKIGDLMQSLGDLVPAWLFHRLLTCPETLTQDALDALQTPPDVAGWSLYRGEAKRMHDEAKALKQGLVGRACLENTSTSDVYLLDPQDAKLLQRGGHYNVESLRRAGVDPVLVDRMDVRSCPVDQFKFTTITGWNINGVVL